MPVFLLFGLFRKREGLKRAHVSRNGWIALRRLAAGAAPWSWCKRSVDRSSAPEWGSSGRIWPTLRTSRGLDPRVARPRQGAFGSRAGPRVRPEGRSAGGPGRRGRLRYPQATAVWNAPWLYGMAALAKGSAPQMRAEASEPPSILPYQGGGVGSRSRLDGASPNSFAPPPFAGGCWTGGIGRRERLEFAPVFRDGGIAL